MSMRRRTHGKQSELWIASEDIAESPGHPFCRKLNSVLRKHGFDTFVEALKKAGAKDVTYLRIDGAGHGVYGQAKKQTAPAMEKFFARTLKRK